MLCSLVYDSNEELKQAAQIFLAFTSCLLILLLQRIIVPCLLTIVLNKH